MILPGIGSRQFAKVIAKRIADNAVTDRAAQLSYDVKESRPWWKVQAIAIVITIATSALMLFAIAGLALGGGVGVWLAGKLHVDQYWTLLWSWLRWPITAAGVMLVLALLYYFLP